MADTLWGAPGLLQYAYVHNRVTLAEQYCKAANALDRAKQRNPRLGRH